MLTLDRGVDKLQRRSDRREPAFPRAAPTIIVPGAPHLVVPAAPTLIVPENPAHRVALTVNALLDEIDQRRGVLTGLVAVMSAPDGIRVRTAGAIPMPDTVNFLQHLSRALAENDGFVHGETLVARRPVMAPEFGHLPAEWFE